MSEPAKAKPKTFFSIGDYIAIGSLLTGLVGAILTAQITITHFKQARTTSYIERINNPEVAKVRSVIDTWLNSSLSDKEKLDYLASDLELKSSLRMFLNILTELGIAYKYGLVDRELTNEIWNPLIPLYWEKLQFYVYGSRIRGDNTGYYFEYISKEIMAHAEKNKKRTLNRYPYPDYYTVAGEIKKTEHLIKSDSKQTIDDEE